MNSKSIESVKFETIVPHVRVTYSGGSEWVYVLPQELFDIARRAADSRVVMQSIICHQNVVGVRVR